MSSSTVIEERAASEESPRREDEGYMLVPIPSLRPVSLPMASWSPVIILTLTPSSIARRMVSALSCLGGSKRGSRPKNSHGSPALSFVFSGTLCQQIQCTSFVTLFSFLFLLINEFMASSIRNYCSVREYLVSV
ncbi:hypothetical protein V8G54_005373, partial [Vigna mungo]